MILLASAYDTVGRSESSSIEGPSPPSGVAWDKGGSGGANLAKCRNNSQEQLAHFCSSL